MKSVRWPDLIKTRGENHLKFRNTEADQFPDFKREDKILNLDDLK